MSFLCWILLSFLLSFGLVSSFMVVFSNSPVFSIFFLILAFCDVSLTLFFLEVDYVPLMLLIIYVGAVAVLFIFVVMMLNLKIVEMKENNTQFSPVLIVFCVLFALQINAFLQLNFSFCTSGLLNESLSNDFLCSFTESIQLFQRLPNICLLAFLLFKDYYLMLLISSLILLVGLISAISLTLRKNFLLKKQNVSLQVLKNFNKQTLLFS